eukprot:m.251731 g.251731  ORF g.251731 m.251731 type:complete len:411 (-) comp26506_c3_seq28:72-1304(-)
MLAVRRAVTAGASVVVRGSAPMSALGAAPTHSIRTVAVASVTSRSRLLHHSPTVYRAESTWWGDTAPKTPAPETPEQSQPKAQPARSKPSRGKQPKVARIKKPKVRVDGAKLAPLVAPLVINHPKILLNRAAMKEKKSTDRLARMRKMFRRADPKSYTKAVGIFKRHKSRKSGDVPLYALMLDYTYSMKRQREILNSLESLVELRGESGVGTGVAYAGAINLAILHADTNAATRLWQQANARDPTCARLKMLKKRPEKRLSATRAETIIKAGKLGRGADGMRLFDAMCTAGVATQVHYEAALWSCDTYAKQAEHWARMDAERVKNGWTPASMDAFNAVVWRLYLEDRPEDIHRVLVETRRLGLTPNDRTLHAVQRMGERLAQRKRQDRDSWASWHSTFTMTPSPRLRVGL